MGKCRISASWCSSQRLKQLRARERMEELLQMCHEVTYKSLLPPDQIEKPPRFRACKYRPSKEPRPPVRMKHPQTYCAIYKKQSALYPKTVKLLPRGTAINKCYCLEDKSQMTDKQKLDALDRHCQSPNICVTVATSTKNLCPKTTKKRKERREVHIRDGPNIVNVVQPYEDNCKCEDTAATSAKNLCPKTTKKGKERRKIYTRDSPNIVNVAQPYDDCRCEDTAATSTKNLCPKTTKKGKEKRKVYTRDSPNIVNVVQPYDDNCMCEDNQGIENVEDGSNCEWECGLVPAYVSCVSTVNRYCPINTCYPPEGVQIVNSQYPVNNCYCPKSNYQLVTPQYVISNCYPPEARPCPYYSQIVDSYCGICQSPLPRW